MTSTTDISPSSPSSPNNPNNPNSPLLYLKLCILLNTHLSYL